MKYSTPDANEADRYTRAAKQLIDGGSAGDELLRESGSIPGALPVLTQELSLHSWFVPVTVEDRLAAFFQFLPNVTLLRFSSFQRRPGDLTGCPAAADWLDAERIRERARSHRQTGETLGEPFLTYDRSPDRLVWAVPLIHKDGVERLVYVTGESVYLPPSGGMIG